MKITKITDYCTQLKPETKKITLMGFGIFLLLVSFSLITYCFGELIVPDFDTVLYYSEELFLSAKECLGATVIPALLYEIFIRLMKIK